MTQVPTPKWEALEANPIGIGFLIGRRQAKEEGEEE